MLQVSVGGILVGLIMRYADNVIKGFATANSIVLSSFLSALIPAFDFTPTAAFVAGSALVILATIIYSSPQAGSHVKGAAMFEAAAARSSRHTESSTMPINGRLHSSHASGAVRPAASTAIDTV